MRVVGYLASGRLEMKSINFKGTIGKAFLAFSLLFGIGIMSSTMAQAQWQQDSRDRYDNRDYQNNQDRDWRRERNGRWNDRRNGRNGGDGYGNYGGSYELRQTALNAGANDGNK